MKIIFDDAGNIVESNMLIKIQKIEYLKQIQDGRIYMKNLDFFRKMEQCGVGDEKEGLLAEFCEGEVIFNGMVIAGVKNISTNLYANSPVLCLFRPKFERINENHYQCIITKKTIDELAWDENSEYGVLIIQRPEFEKKMIDRLNELDIGYAYGNVVYTDNFDIPPKEERYKVAFRKRKIYEEQSEYRWLLNIDVDNDYVLEIGDISGFSQIIPIKEHKDIPIEVIM